MPSRSARGGEEARLAQAAGRPADARGLPCEDGAFDGVLVLGPLHHLRERADRVRAPLGVSAHLLGRARA
ncbi:hypothetical protein [Streptomyces mayteni]